MDLDGSCTVDGGDLAVILGNWGAIPEPPGLSSLDYQQQSARFCTSVDSIEATIDGSLEMNAETQVLSGSLIVTFQDDLFVSMLFGPGGMVMQSGDSKIAVEWSDPFYDPYVIFDGQSVLPGVVINDLESDFRTHGMTPSAWSEQSRMLMAQSIVYETPAFQRNTVAVMAAGEAGGPGFWCKTAAIAAGAAITAVATAGCAALTAACAIGTSVSFGGLSIPCTGLIGLCAGGVFAGAAAAYELALAAWGG